MTASAFAVWLNTAFASFDAGIAIAIHNLYEWGGGFFTPFFHFVSFLGKDGIVLILLSLALLYFPKTRKYGMAMALALIIGTLITNVSIKPLVSRPRGYTIDGSIYQQFWATVGKPTESDYSFPSGHTTAAMEAALAFFLIYHNKKWWPVLLFPVFMGISRIYLSVHYCTDVIGGLLVGALAGVLGYLIAERIPEKIYSYDLNPLVFQLINGKKSTQNGRHLKR